MPLGFSSDALEKLMVNQVGKGEHKAANLPEMAPRLTAVFELAEAERVTLKHTFIGTEHLLLGLLAEAESGESDQKGMAIQFLGRLGVDGRVVKEKIEAVFN